ncbi:tRNA(His) guanylyltransferase Thg1 family protein [Photobacterium phosphoreum]|uniref:tRNA(His) guanylyltransferase Thg1 family protein n=1 Tax=Photobacterium phosphoreum TaxID=659 RepID=UPI0015E65B89|nr:tRNA(His) guanylyltransferase Thg1 family protein [Photobacterium phosphoreum]
MKELPLIKDLCAQRPLFENIEKQSAALVTTPPQHYLIVRLDGIGLSKKYLKDSLVNKAFKEIMTQAIQETYCVLHRQSKSNAKQVFLGAVMASDEVSFIFNTSDNYFDKRLFKTVTTLASTLSCFFTRDGAKYLMMGSFDGRPLVVENLQQVNDYIAHRLAIYCRNTMAKTLRLDGVPDNELYSDSNNNNLDYYQAQFEQRNINLDDIIKSCTLFLPSLADDKRLNTFKNKSLEKLITMYCNSMTKFEQHLTEVNYS